VQKPEIPEAELVKIENASGPDDNCEYWDVICEGVKTADNPHTV